MPHASKQGPSGALVVVHNQINAMTNRLVRAGFGSTLVHPYIQDSHPLLYTLAWSRVFLLSVRRT